MKNIIVITKNFDENFTGATRATTVYMSLLEDHFGRIDVFCLPAGKHALQRGEVHICSNVPALLAAVRKAARKDSTAMHYSDDHFGFLLRLAGIPYTHIYHGNWPQAMTVSLAMFLKSFYFRPLYWLTIRFAHTVVHTAYGIEYVWRPCNSRNVMIRNGVRTDDGARTDKSSVKAPGFTKILMVGNIDKRKYTHAPKLLQLLEKAGTGNKIQIDIYGNTLDRGLEKKISRHAFVQLKGFHPNFAFQEYDLLLSLSTSENMAISCVEALVQKAPVVHFNVGGLIEVIKTGENGFVIPDRGSPRRSQRTEKDCSKRAFIVRAESRADPGHWAQRCRRCHAVVIRARDLLQLRRDAAHAPDVLADDTTTAESSQPGEIDL